MAKLNFGQEDESVSSSSQSKSTSSSVEENYNPSEETSGGLRKAVRTWKFWGVAVFGALVIFTMYIQYPG